MDFNTRKVIEALRSGIPSRDIGSYFSSARTELIADISEWMGSDASGGRILTASYGEGKTHFLNTVFKIAQNKNMAVSLVSLSRETPFNNLHLIYKKIAQNTFLPNREQPGFECLLDELSPANMVELQLYTAKELQADKLFYLLKAYCNTDNADVKFSLITDIYGDFVTLAGLKKIYKDIFAERITYSVNFTKTRHIWDYYLFLNRLFSLAGLNGWIVLFDESEHIGRLGRKSRFNAYANMARFLYSSNNSAKTLFTMTSNYKTEVIEGKDERGYLAQAEGFDHELISATLDLIENAAELTPIDQSEFFAILNQIIDFHARAYNWAPDVDNTILCDIAWSRGYYLRTKIRAAIEYLDQLYQYGSVGDITAGELEQETYVEEIPLPNEI